MKTLIIIAIDIAHLQPGEAPCKTPGGFLPSAYCPSCATWTSLSSGHRGMELYQRCPRWSSSGHQRFMVYFVSTVWTGLPRHCIYSSGESLPVSRKTGWFQTVCLSTEVTTSIARWKLRALVSFVFLYCKKATLWLVRFGHNPAMLFSNLPSGIWGH